MKKLSLLILISLIACQSFAGSVLDVAWTIYKESRGESLYGKHAVATVIYNRAANQRKTYTQIVSKKYQFSPWLAGKPEMYYNDVFDQCMEIAVSMHNGTFEPLANWTHFYNPALCSPSWGNKMTNKRTIGHHLFGNIR